MTEQELDAMYDLLAEREEELTFTRLGGCSNG